MRQSFKASVLALALTLALGTALGIGIAHNQSVAAVPAKHKVVFQVTDSDRAKWELTLSNIKNIQGDLGKDKVEVEILAYGPGLGMLQLDSTVASRIAEAQQDGVKVVACENTMNGLHLTKEDMLANIAYVKTGVSEIMRLQEAGYSYVRP